MKFKANIFSLLLFVCIIQFFTLVVVLNKTVDTQRYQDDLFDEVQLTNLDLNKEELVSFIVFEDMDSPSEDLFITSLKSVDQLKYVCAHLDSCKGFNSNGWLKSSVDTQVESPGGTLYVKQVVPSANSRHSVVKTENAGFFQPFLSEYKRMLKEFKIYIYHTSIGSKVLSVKDYKYGVEDLFIKLLSRSPFVVSDSNMADLYFLPLRCTAYRKSIKDLQEGIIKAQLTAKEMIKEISIQYPFWNSSLGRNHFYICAHDMGTELLTGISEWNHVIGLVNTASLQSNHFIPHKDVSIPNHPGRGTVSWQEIGKNEMLAFSERSQLVFFAGNSERGPVRPDLFHHFKGMADVKLVAGYMLDGDYMDNLRITKFCLCPRGLEVWSPRLIESLWFGCIPVIIADHYVLPLERYLDWSEFSIIVPESKVGNLVDILSAVTSKRGSSLQAYGQKAIQHLTWNDPPRPFDAFYSIMFELWSKTKWRHKHLF